MPQNYTKKLKQMALLENIFVRNAVVSNIICNFAAKLEKKYDFPK